MSSPVLPGLRVLDHGHVWAGPLLGNLFADMGAEVIKVQAPNRLSGVSMGGRRAPSGSLGGDRGDVPVDDPRAFHGLDRGKHSITLDLSTAQGVDLYKQLATKTDVIFDNFSPGVMDRLGVGYEALRAVNPGIIVAALSAAGATPGPWKDLVTYGPSLAALYGLKGLLGYPDDPQPREDTADLDPTAAAHAFVAIMAALEYRDRSGRGQFIDVAQGEATLQRIGEPLMDYLFNGRVAGPQGNGYPGAAPHGVYPAAGEDRWLAIVVRTDAEWEALLTVAGGAAPQLRQACFARGLERVRDQDALDDAVAVWTRTEDAQALAQRLQAAGVPAFPVMGPADLLADANFMALCERGVDLSAAPFLRGSLFQGVAWKLPATPGALSRPVPNTGEGNAYVFGEVLGLSEAEQLALHEAGVI